MTVGELVKELQKYGSKKKVVTEVVQEDFGFGSEHILKNIDNVHLEDGKVVIETSIWRESQDPFDDYGIDYEDSIEVDQKKMQKKWKHVLKGLDGPEYDKFREWIIKHPPER